MSEATDLPTEPRRKLNMPKESIVLCGTVIVTLKSSLSEKRGVKISLNVVPVKQLF